MKIALQREIQSRTLQQLGPHAEKSAALHDIRIYLILVVLIYLF